MKYATVAEIREFDKALLTHVNQEDLLARAAAGVSDFVSDMCGNGKPDVYVLPGKGFNGEDAKIAGRNLDERGFRVMFCGGSGETALPFMVRRGSVIIDGVLGIGAKDPPRGAALEMIRWINSMRGRAKIVAVDVPSGWNADTGEPFSGNPDDVVAADYTVCMGLPKIGMAREGSLRWCGCVYAHDLGDSVRRPAEPSICSAGRLTPPNEMITESDVNALVPPRKWDGHKGDYGHVVVIGGAVGYAGAPVIAATGAMRSGAGLVSLLMPESCRSGFIPPIPPEVMVRPLEQHFDLTGKVVVVGPGYAGCTSDDILRLANESGARGIVIDADGLNAFKGKAELMRKIKVPCIITPHPGEAAKLLGESGAARGDARPPTLEKLVGATGATVVLKGAGTLVSAPGEGVHLAPFANPGMSKGGMGDFLAGMCGACLARGFSAFGAARVAAWKHADAGARCAWRLGHDTMRATDLLS